MDAYVFQAAFICEDCEPQVQTDIIMRGLDQPCGWAKFVGWEREDSNHFPQGPYADGGGEADTPQHCDRCGVFLENPLTTEGYEYIRSIIPTKRADASDVELEWADYYDVVFPGDEYPEGDAA